MHARENFEKASLSIAKDALAGAMLLNMPHTPSIKRLYDFSILRVAWTEKLLGEPAFKVFTWKRDKEYLGENSPFFVETAIFPYNYGKG